MLGFLTSKLLGILGALAGLLQGFLLLFAYLKGKAFADREASESALKRSLKDSINAQRQMDSIRKLSDRKLDDKLRR